FNEMSPPLCDALLEINNSSQILRQLVDGNLFTFPLDAEGSWYQYHQLFREFLLAKFQRDEPERYRQLCLRQAEIMIHQGQWQHAIESYLSAQAYEEAAKAIEAIASETFDRSQWDALKSWIDALPEEIKERHPRLLFFRGKIYAEQSQPDRAINVLQHAYALYLAQGDEIGAARALSQQGIAHRFRGEFHRAIDILKQALEMAEKKDPFAALQAHHQLGITYNLQGQFSKGLVELHHALKIAEESGDDINAAFIAHDLGTSELTLGELRQAQRHYHRALMHWRKIGNLSSLSSTLQGLGLIHQYLGQYAEASYRFEEALEKARQAADTRLEAYALTNQGDLQRDTGKYKEALASYQQALEAAARAQASHLILYILIASGDAHRLAKNLARARQVLTEALDQINEKETPLEAGLCHLALGALASDEGQLEEAQRHLQQAQALFEALDTKRELGRTHLQLALLAHRRRDKTQAKSHLQEVGHLVKEMGSHQFIVAEGPNILPLLSHAEEESIPGLDYARIRSELEQLFPQTRPTTRIRIIHTFMPLEFLALDGSQVLKEGRVVTSWESTIARIAAFLFAAHPQGLHREQVIELLWPEVNPAKGNSLFHSTMHRIRRALSKKVIIYQKGVYRLNPELTYRYDAAEFQRLAKLGQGESEAAHLARQEAIALYRTPFLETCELEWCANTRLMLAQELIELLLKEGAYLASQEPPEAEALYLRAAGLEPYDERAQRGLMWCRAKRGDRAGAIRQYREFARLLQEDLQTEPAPETTALYQAILEGQLPPAPL
ncbi:MAG: tetratricopeptide repeat protein, partial [Anaerolineae bacterium]|nr:tetratricopeptide repeat protein [Anaerolineae bacterium]